MNKKITFHYIGKIEIRYDPSRTNGRWYAYVPLIREEIVDGTRKIDVISRLESAIEITINGPGISKARRKIMQRLRMKGITHGQDLEFSLVYLINLYKK